MQCVFDDDDNVRAAASRCCGGMGTVLTEALVTDLILDLLPTSSSATSSWQRKAGAILSSASCIHTAGQHAAEVRDDVFKLIRTGAGDERVPVKIATCQALATLLTPQTHAVNGGGDRKAEFRACAQAVIAAFHSDLSTLAADEAGDVRCAAIAAIKKAAKGYRQATARHLSSFVPPLVTGARDLNMRVKHESDRALKYLLEGGNPQTTNTVASQLDGETGTFLKDYAKRILVRMPDDSDGEGDKW